MGACHDRARYPRSESIRERADGSLCAPAPARRGADARTALRSARAAVSTPTQSDRGVAGQGGAKGLGRPAHAALLDAHPELRPGTPGGGPHRTGADAGPRPGPRQPRVAARRQFDRHGAGLAGGGEGRADQRSHHAAAARQGAGRHHRQVAANGGAVRWPVARRAATGAGAAPSAGAYRALQRAGSAKRSGGAGGGPQRPLRSLPHGGRRHCLAGLHLGHHRQAQSGGAHPPRRVGRLRNLAAPRVAGHAP